MSFTEICMGAIAVAIWVIVIFGENITGYSP